MAAMDLDAVIIDMEHGAVDHGSAHAMIAATSGTDCAPLVRVAQNETNQVKRVLDLGAEGIVFPMIRTAEDARNAVASLRYAPEGTRGFGPFLAQSRWQTTLAEYPAKEQDNLICCLLVETADAVQNIEEICAVPGIDLLIPAQFDLSTDLGVMGQFGHPVFQDALARIEAAANAANLPLGNVALTRDAAQTLFGRGYRFIASFDILWLREKAGEIKSWCDA
jgi:4-hydroxy-2-oxoheptanedioate aldolase